MHLQWLKGTELQDKLEEANIMLKEAKDEIAALKETNLQFSSSPGEPTHVEVSSGFIRGTCDMVFCSMNQ